MNSANNVLLRDDYSLDILVATPMQNEDNEEITTSKNVKDMDVLLAGYEALQETAYSDPNEEIL